MRKTLTMMLLVVAVTVVGLMAADVRREEVQDYFD
jgi:hypothetical protein